MRKLTYPSLLLMDGEKVIVHDLAYDSYDQECEVKVGIKPEIIKTKRTTKVKVLASKIQFINEEYIFEYNEFGKCVNGDFEVYSK